MPFGVPLMVPILPDAVDIVDNIAVRSNQQLDEGDEDRLGTTCTRGQTKTKESLLRGVRQIIISPTWLSASISRLAFFIWPLGGSHCAIKN